MSLPSETRFVTLLSRYLDEGVDQIDEVELAEALSDEQFAARFVEMTTLNAEIAGLMARSIPDTVMIDLVLRDVRGEPAANSSYASLSHDASPTTFSERQWRSGPLVRRTLAIAAGASLLALAVFWLFGGLASKPAARVAAVRGNVTIVDAAGEVALQKPQSLKGSGELHTTGPESRATFLLGDHTRIELAGDTHVEFDPAANRVFLKQGTLRAHVTPGKAPPSLIFATGNSEATVRGTTFTLMWDDPNSLVAVTKGTVSIRRLRDGYTLEVRAGEYAHVENGGNFFTWPLRALTKARRDRVQFSE